MLQFALEAEIIGRFFGDAGQPVGEASRIQEIGLKFKDQFLRQYLMLAPMSLSIYRTLECDILATKKFPRPILDIGCGDGIFTKVLFDETIDCGIDPQEHEVDKARNSGMYDEAIVCFGDAIPKPDNSFSTIMSNSTWEHIPDLEPVVREAQRLLAPGGVVHLTIPTNLLDRSSVPSRLLEAVGLNGLAAKYRSFFNRFWNHHNYYSLAEWRAVFENCGFKVVEEVEYGSPGIVAAFDLLLPFAIPANILDKIAGRWILSQTLRGLYVAPLEWFVATLMKLVEKRKPGAMVYYALTK